VAATIVGDEVRTGVDEWDGEPARTPPAVLGDAGGPAPDTGPMAAVPRDRDAFAEVFSAEHGRALRLAYLMCADAERSQDVVADAFARMYPHWRRGRVTDPGSYVRRAVVNGVRGGFRHRAIERREEAKWSGEGRGQRDAADDVVDRDAVRHALASLPPRQRAAVVLRYFEDLSEADTAAALGVSVGTVKAHVSRGLDRLRDALAKVDVEQATPVQATTGSELHESSDVESSVTSRPESREPGRSSAERVYGDPAEQPEDGGQ